jgi:BirA family biotin operon repressor/biotin-[acetyl-CoA-carboxylase] ligase
VPDSANRDVPRLPGRRSINTEDTAHPVRDVVDSLTRTFPDAVENAVYLDRVDSTHALSLRLMEQMDDQGLGLGPTVIIAAQQTLGRGRGDRRWQSPEGGLYLSWTRSGFPKDTIRKLPMLAAAAAHHAVSVNGVANAGIKWPNDIVVDRKKLAGILIHVRSAERGWVTVGLGVNLETAPELSHTTVTGATAMAHLVEPVPFERWCVGIAGEFVSSLTRVFADTDRALDLWRSQLIHRPGERLSVRLGGGETATGRFRGLTAEGFLRLGTNGSERIITSGDIFETG